MSEKLYWLGFNLVPRIGPMRVRALLERFDSLRAAWRAPSTSLKAAGLDRRALENLTRLRGELDLQAEMAKVEKQGIHLLTWIDDDYPRLLIEIDDPPPVLFVRGEFKPADEWAVAMVGTRRATSYGKETARQMSSDLARNGVTVVSGLARGIDSISHRAALDAGGRTIAVLGCGLDIVYPPENRSLAQAIAANGALVSEYPLGTQPDGRNFPPRNRIISGLSLGTVVVEGDTRSGAMITARDSLEQNREVFAVPGDITRRSSRGTNALIRDSAAKLVVDVEDILAELNLSMIQQHTVIREAVPENETEALLLKQISHQPTHVDEIGRRAERPIAEVSGALALTELKGMVRQVGGMNYVLARESQPSYDTE
jgi:DNA processing protein